jgi:preprotein translocase subunit SecE
MATSKIDNASTPIPKTGRGGLKGYFGEVTRELRKVQWPTPKETTRLTGVVLAVCGICVAVMFAMSYVITTLMGLIQGGN